MKCNHNNQQGIASVLFLIVTIICVLILMYPVFSYSSKDNVYQVTITDKERIVKKEDSYYLVFTDKEVFTNTDTFLHWKFNSSDVQNHLKVDSTCDVEVYWYRVPFLSWYRDIISVSNCKEGGVAK